MLILYQGVVPKLLKINVFRIRNYITIIMSLITIRNSVAVNQSTSWSKGNNQCKSIWVAWHELFPMFHVPLFCAEGSYLPWTSGLHSLATVLSDAFSDWFCAIFLPVYLFAPPCFVCSLLQYIQRPGYYRLNFSPRMYAHSEQLTQTACSLWTTHTECTLWTAHTESMHNLNSSHRMHAQFEQLT